MKKLGILIPVCLILATAVWAVTAGDAGDPLASLSYLQGTFAKTVQSAVDSKLDAAAGSGGASQSADAAETWTEIRLKQRDQLKGSTGTQILLLAGSARVESLKGTVVDATTGETVKEGGALTANHRYLAAEDTTASVAVTSKTAVLDYQGAAAFSYSDAVDYNAMAGALKTLNLFRGSFTGYGQGYDLEVAPTRLQALIMFIRVLGEEEAALNWKGTTPFTDIQKGSDAEKYVGYAYDHGYTNGYTANLFKPANPVNAHQYTEFMLRAMGYSSVANTDLSDTLERAWNNGVLREGEVEMLKAGTFLRAELVYISYYGLRASLPDGRQTLAESLQDKGVFTSAQWKAAQSAVPGKRL